MRLHVPAAVRRVCGLGLAAALFLTLAGATYQGVTTALERRQFPHPGRLVDIGGHQLHIFCTGEGSPTVVLEAPAASMSAAWALVQPRIERTTRVCSYDRSGLGWSEVGDQRYEASRVADELKRLLDAAGERAPFIAVGSGLGSAFATMFAARNAASTVALVLVEPPDEESGLRENRRLRVTTVTPWVARVGIRRALRVARPVAAGLPEPSAGATRMFLYRPDHLSRAAAEQAQWRDAVQLARSSRPAAPVAVTTGDSADAIAAAIEEAIGMARR